MILILLVLCAYLLSQTHSQEFNKSLILSDKDDELIVSEEEHSGECTQQFNVVDRAVVQRVIWIYTDHFTSVSVRNMLSVQATIHKLFNGVRHYFMCPLFTPSAKGVLPCQTIYFTSWTPDYIQEWHIQIPKWFLIIIYIFDAYIPFSDTCRPSQLAVYNGFNITQPSLVDSFCGVVTMETVYTNRNKGTLVIAFNSSNIPYAVTLDAEYQAHSISLAFRKPLPCLPDFIISNRHISVLYFYDQRLYYFWYVTHGLYYNLTTYYDGYTGAIRYQHVDINECGPAAMSVHLR